MPTRRFILALVLAFIAFAAPAGAARPIVDLHSLDAYFALFASDSNVPWKPTTVRLDTYSGAPVAFAVYQVDPADVITAGSNERNRAIDTRGRRPIAAFTYTPPGAYQFESNEVTLPLGSREGFFVVEARRGNVGEQVWINRTRVGLVTKETPGELALFGVDLGTGRSAAKAPAPSSVTCCCARRVAPKRMVTVTEPPEGLRSAPTRVRAKPTMRTVSPACTTADSARTPTIVCGNGACGSSEVKA